jgi:hypothetical protein
VGAPLTQLPNFPTFQLPIYRSTNLPIYQFTNLPIPNYLIAFPCEKNPYVDKPFFSYILKTCRTFMTTNVKIEAYALLCPRWSTLPEHSAESDFSS